MTLFDLMMVWEVPGSRREIEQLGLCILLAFAEQDNINVRLFSRWWDKDGQDMPIVKHATRKTNRHINRTTHNIQGYNITLTTSQVQEAIKQNKNNT